jgi:hypothetical protein
VIAVFTKYDQFKRDIGMKLEDQRRDPAILNDEMEKIFNKEFLANLKGSPPSVRLESKLYLPITMHYANCRCTGMHKPGQRCSDLIQMTANPLSTGVVSLMLLSVQKNNLELNIKQAVTWYVRM